MGQHTSGPWVAEAEFDMDGEETHVVKGGAYYVATCHDYAGAISDEQNTAANARLIAAAPCLLETAERMIECVNATRAPAEIIDAMRAAIGKAKGMPW